MSQDLPNTGKIHTVHDEGPGATVAQSMETNVSQPRPSHSLLKLLFQILKWFTIHQTVNLNPSAFVTFNTITQQTECFLLPVAGPPSDTG
jgi:hypothetical protein